MAKVTKTSGLTASDVSGLLEVREDNAEQIAQAMDKAVARALESMGLLGEGYAKKLCPVDTGRLRNSITHQLDTSEKSVYIGTNVEYAECVELGTRRQKAQPYLRPAATDHADRYRQVLKSELGK